MAAAATQIAAHCKDLAENQQPALAHQALAATIFAPVSDIELAFWAGSQAPAGTMEAFAALPDFIVP